MAEEIPSTKRASEPSAALILGFFGSLVLAATLALLFNPTSLCGDLGREKAKIVCPLLF